MSGIPDSFIIISGVGLILSMVKVMHNQVILKLEQVVKSNGEIKESLAVHSTKLEASASEFATIREHQKIQDEKISHLANKLAKIEAKGSVRDCLN